MVVDGGYYSTGEHSDGDFGALYVESADSAMAPRVELKGGVVFDYLDDVSGSTVFDRLFRERRPGIVASGNGRVVVKDNSVVVRDFADPFVAHRKCIDRCATQKAGSVVRCASNPSSPECR